MVGVKQRPPFPSKAGPAGQQLRVAVAGAGWAGARFQPVRWRDAGRRLQGRSPLAPPWRVPGRLSLALDVSGEVCGLEAAGSHVVTRGKPGTGGLRPDLWWSASPEARRSPCQ